jgi:hypothetical protein
LLVIEVNILLPPKHGKKKGKRKRRAAVRSPKSGKEPDYPLSRSARTPRW